MHINTNQINSLPMFFGSLENGDRFIFVHDFDAASALKQSFEIVTYVKRNHHFRAKEVGSCKLISTNNNCVVYKINLPKSLSKETPMSRVKVIEKPNAGSFRMLEAGLNFMREGSDELYIKLSNGDCENSMKLKNDRWVYENLCGHAIVIPVTIDTVTVVREK